MEGPELWRELGQQLRVDSVRAAAVTKSGHPTSSMSAADLMAVLLAEHLRYDFDDPDDPRNDHLVFSKGHASPLVYSMYKAAGAITDDELLTFRKFGSRLEGHPTPGPALGRRGHRLARAGAAVRRRASRSRASAWTSSRIGSGCCAATARWPRARCGRPSSTPGTRSSTTWSRSSTSTGSASAARRCTAGTSTRTRSGPRRSAGTRSRSTGTTSRRSTRRTARPRRRPACRR